MTWHTLQETVIGLLNTVFFQWKRSHWRITILFLSFPTQYHEHFGSQESLKKFGSYSYNIFIDSCITLPVVLGLCWGKSHFLLRGTPAAGCLFPPNITFSLKKGRFFSPGLACPVHLAFILALFVPSLLDILSYTQKLMTSIKVLSPLKLMMC